MRAPPTSDAWAIPEYSVYGLTVRADRALAGLHPAPSADAPDIVVHFSARPPWGDRPAAADGLVYRAESADPDPPVVEAAWVEGGSGLRLRYADGVEFHVSTDAREIWATWPAPLTLEDAALYLLGPVLGYALRRRGVLSLHASGALIDGRAAAFCGASGAGKSTIAAAAAAAGHAALTDDVLALREVRGETMAYPANSHLRVWDDSARILAGEGHALLPLTPNWDKLALSLEALGHPVAREPAPLGWIFLLADRAADASAPRVERVRAADAFVPLVANTSANYLLSPEMRATEFAALARVLQQTAVFRVVPHTDPASLPTLLQRVVEAARA